MVLNPLSGRALYRQAADLLRDRVEGDGADLLPGDELPSEAELQDELGVGPGTLRRALQILIAEGSVTTERGQLHKVAEPPVIVTVVVGSGAVIGGRVARPRDAARFGVREGAPCFVVTEADVVRMFEAASTRIVFRR